MKNLFEDYLIKQGYSVKTPSGNPSTVYDYIKRIDRVCLNENMTWNELAGQIYTVVTQYDIGGCKEELGRKSHNAVINALKRFGDFVDAK
ncbi:hypothetical protein [Fusibacter bizertensis]